MKVEGPGPLRPASGTQKAGRTSGTGFSKLLGGDSPSGPGGVSGAGPTAGIDALLALQTVGDATEEGNQRGRKRGQELLDKLEELRLCLLGGAIPRDKLLELAQSAQSRRAQVSDPKLAAVLDEIDLRAQVELAKYAPVP
ncbi:MAG TPA: flagellar assembly protein FliX [Alphaproteobacteria bacterium]|nr:flagellar assembly protein FliX [Alphaproteobacteria bacterium]